ncbi:uncharacterized protein LOC133199187 [Saccostrea echinata]|uniref:uncharacterized protein LOC133199187 n=1 Tax=Saccostrea echinata TaxID=191078 RepID=UPI002A7FB705|nr:uncharacterized protein LOC133199187 [Saccostrea echinata]
MQLKLEQGPPPITIHVLENVLLRRYGNGTQFGTTYIVSSDTAYRTVKTLVIHEKHLNTIKASQNYVVLKVITLQDGTVKIGQQSVVMHTRKPENLVDVVIDNFQNPPVIDELGRIGSLNNKERISVKGEVSSVSSIIRTNETQRKIVTLTDGNASMEIKLWGALAETPVHEGSSIAITCLHVDVYQGKRSLNSSGGTEVQNVDIEDTFAGFIQAASFDESNTSILIDDELLTCTKDQLQDIFPGQIFTEDKHVQGKKRRSVITSIEEVQLENVVDALIL